MLRRRNVTYRLHKVRHTLPAVIALVATSFLLLGAAIAVLADASPVRPGLLGFVLMLAAALALRRHWLGQAWAAPGSPERSMWVGLATSSVVLGHMLTSLWRLGPALQLHTPAGDALAVDSWSLVAGGALAWWLTREHTPRRDERDRAIDALGMRWSYSALLALLLPSVLLLGFGDDHDLPLSRPYIAHLLIAAMLASIAIGQAVRLTVYRRDAGA